MMEKLEQFANCDFQIRSYFTNKHNNIYFKKIIRMNNKMILNVLRLLIEKYIIVTRAHNYMTFEVFKAVKMSMSGRA